ncbi:AsnC family protein [Pseudonocardia sp. MCCB 268]|nr:AsnC family protein [Pseudonocardia cytotoxica]
MPGRQRRQELDEIDCALVAALRRDGRTPNVELAKLVGVSEKTVRSRIARLVGEHGLTVTARLSDPAQRSRMVYLLLTEPGRRFGVAVPGRAVRGGPGPADHGFGRRHGLRVLPGRRGALRFQVQVVEGHLVRSAQSCHLIGEVGGPRSRPPAGPRVDTEVLAALMIGPPRHPSFDALTDAICDAMTGGLVPTGCSS